jgi:hypothetical protein
MGNVRVTGAMCLGINSVLRRKCSQSKLVKQKLKIIDYWWYSAYATHISAYQIQAYL